MLMEMSAEPYHRRPGRDRPGTLEHHVPMLRYRCPDFVAE